MTRARTHPPDIAVIGGGFTGSLLALHLLSKGPPGAKIFLIEKAPGIGRGLAYGAHNPNHVLNVRVNNMSAFPDQPGHLADWLAARSEGGGPGTFITRGAYGTYIASLIQDALRQPGGAERLVLVPDQAVKVETGAQGVHVRLAMGRVLSVDTAVLCVGNLQPHPPPGLGLETLSPELCAPDPWDGRALDIADPEAPVLLMGTGLTMVDVALNLAARGHRGPIIALSRRGLVPHRHAEVALQPTSDVCCPLQPLSQMLRGRRRRAGEVGWRAAVDELRPYTQDLWRQADPVQRRRFLRHLRPWWDVHRHRMAPQVAGWLEDLRARGGLTVAAGRFCAFTPEGEGLSVTWRPRGEARARILRVGKIINCTGAGGDLSRTPDPLLRDLIAQGSIRADALGLGLEVDGLCQAIGASGRPTPGLYAAGPITQGYSWEVVAVPDIRNQVAQLAALLAERLEPEI